MRRTHYCAGMEMCKRIKYKHEIVVFRSTIGLYDRSRPDIVRLGRPSRVYRNIPDRSRYSQICS